MIDPQAAAKDAKVFFEADFKSRDSSKTCHVVLREIKPDIYKASFTPEGDESLVARALVRCGFKVLASAKAMEVFGKDAYDELLRTDGKEPGIWMHRFYELDWMKKMKEDTTTEAEPSALFTTLVQMIDRVIRHSGSELVNGRVRLVANKILVQLAQCGLVPESHKSKWSNWTMDGVNGHTSPVFNRFEQEIEANIRKSASTIFDNKAEEVASAILLRLASDVDGLVPRPH